MAVTKKPTVKKVAVKKPAAKKAAIAKKPAVKKATTKKVTVDANELAKAAATKAGEPWVSVLSVELDPDNIGNGAMQLDWNDFFIAKLVRAGYKGTDIDMVDMWFSDLCRNVLAENYEQEQADPDNRK